jgi:hypothetical protein
LNANRILLSAVLGLAILSASLTAYILRPLPASELLETRVLENSISSALENDKVIVTVHDSEGNLKSEQETSNIITSAGAIWFCIEQNRCESQITSPDINMINNPTWWIQFISGTPNSNSPTAADCTSPSGGGDLTGQVSGGRCVVNFGAPPAQYQAGGSIITVSTIAAGTGQLQGSSGSYDTTNNYIQTVAASVCSIVDDGTAPSSGTCQFTETTPVLTNMSGGTITVNGQLRRRAADNSRVGDFRSHAGARRHDQRGVDDSDVS